LTLPTGNFANDIPVNTVPVNTVPVAKGEASDALHKEGQGYHVEYTYKVSFI